jgi:UDP-N-acetyl-D-mannosaminuronic acid transferase (WecB/TagA/CpsF family)
MFYKVYFLGESEGCYSTLEEAIEGAKQSVLDYGYKTKKERREIASRICILEVNRIIGGTEFIK